jgi:hypothetical protein
VRAWYPILHSNKHVLFQRLRYPALHLKPVCGMQLELNVDTFETYAWAADQFMFPIVTLVCREYMLTTLDHETAFKYLSLYV